MYAAIPPQAPALSGAEQKGSYMSLYDRLLSGETALSLTGLGYVGMPIAVTFSKKVRVIGFDLNERKIAAYSNGRDPTGEVGDEAVRGCSVEFTSDESRLREASFHIVACQHRSTTTTHPIFHRW